MTQSTKKQSCINVQVLIDYAEGRIDHAGDGQCPDELVGHDVRDPDCPVCRALGGASGQAVSVAEQDARTKKAEVMTVSPRSVICPHCMDEQDGWICDPRGQDHTCDNCDQTYHVPHNVDVKVV